MLNTLILLHIEICSYVFLQTCLITFLSEVKKLPLFFSSRHGVIFETVGSLLSLLRTGDRDMFRQFFMDTMLVIEGLTANLT